MGSLGWATEVCVSIVALGYEYTPLTGCAFVYALQCLTGKIDAKN